MFSPRTAEWFESAFGAPTRAQQQAWPAIASGRHVLVSAPTGSGKTLAAFLAALDRLGDETECGRGTRVLYVTPLKALAYDIERNLRAPLRGIGAEHVTVGIRTGDTPQRERAAMARRPPDILVTTPESLYLILTSQAREMLAAVETVIVDEIHAVAHSKRGSHLALSLERLESLVRANGGESSSFQRIGLSATQNPLEEIGRYLVGPGREVTIVDAGARKPLDLRIEVPVESMTEPGGPARADADPLDPPAPEPLAGGEATRASIWPAIYPELLRLVREHTSTIVFVNNRRSAERVALRLNELAVKESEEEDHQTPETAEPAAPVEIARAHHGSLAREERTKVEELLKAGALPCLVATCSLELGIDMGAVDLVLQIESPKSVARGLQRIGRAGHGVGEVSRGRIFPKFRGDLLECAVVARRMREGADRADGGAAQRAGRARPADRRDRGLGGAGRDRSVDELHALVRARTPTPSSPASCWRTCSTCSTAATPRASSASCARASCGTASPATSARARGPASSRSPTRARSPTAGSTRSRSPTGAASASWTRRWSTRRARVRCSCWAPPRGGSRRSAATA